MTASARTLYSRPMVLFVGEAVTLAHVVRGLTLARFGPSGPTLAGVGTRLWAPAKDLDPKGPLLAARGAPRLAAIPR